MWRAAAPRRRLVAFAVVSLLAGLAATLPADALAGTSTSAERSSVGDLWAVEFGRRSVVELRPALAGRLRKAGINLVVINRAGLTRTQVTRLRRRATRSGLFSVNPYLEERLGFATTVAKCRRLDRSNPDAACAVVASSLDSARRLARKAEIDLVIVHLRKPRGLRSLAAIPARARLLGLARLTRSNRVAGPWRKAIALASTNSSVDLGVAPRGVGRRRALTWYLRVLRSARMSSQPQGSVPPEAAPPTNAPATVYVSSTGLDSNSGRSPESPFRTLSRAYQEAAPGEVVEVAGGSYLGETIAVDPAKTSSADVVFRPAPGAAVSVVGQLEVDGKHIEFADMFIGAVRSWGGVDLTFRNVHVLTASFIQGAHDIRFVGGEVGPNLGTGSSDGIFFGSTDGPIRNVLIDGVTFHDITRPYPDAHSDCVQFTVGENVTIRRSKFFNCYDANLIIKDDQGRFVDFTIENNFFGDTTNGYYGLQFYGIRQPCSNIVIRNNSFLENMYVHCPAGALTMRVVGNIEPWMTAFRCGAGTDGTWSHNLYETGVSCPGENGYVVPDGNVGYVNRAAVDLRLTTESEAIDRGYPSSYPLSDYDGTPRPVGAGPDAGGDEAQ